METILYFKLINYKIVRCISNITKGNTIFWISIRYYFVTVEIYSYFILKNS